MAKTQKQVRVTIGEKNIPVGLLRFEADGRRQMSAFEYDTSWLEAPFGFDISPDLPRQEGAFYNSSSHESRRLALPGVMSDATPDSWGRSLMRRALGEGLDEFEFLTLSDDRTRQGALRYLCEDGQQIVDPERAISRRTIPLETLHHLANVFDRDPIRAEAEARELVGLVGSLGGARPKANIIGDQDLWIAKFTSDRDNMPIEQVEVATLKLAGLAGLRASRADLGLKNTGKPVALIHRFDRHQNSRIPYMSAYTAVGRRSDATYDQIAELMRRISEDPIGDMKELYSRIAFTILVSNVDDHLKNHGFLYLGENRWGLAPAFDINPQADRRRSLETPISELSGHEASIEALIEAAPLFELTEDEGLLIAAHIGTVIRENWRGCLREVGVTGGAANAYKNAFENPEMGKLMHMIALRKPVVADPFETLTATPDDPSP